VLDFINARSGVGGETVNFFVHISLSYIGFPMMFPLGVRLLSIQGWCILRVLDHINAFGGVGGETMNLFVHISLSYIGFFMMPLVMSLIMQRSTLESFVIRTIWNEWHVTSHSSIKRREDLGSKTVDLFIHSPLSNIWLLVMLVVLVMLVKASSVL
jgi:hypothetical protein